MNPFTESTVARPLPDHERTSYWAPQRLNTVATRFLQSALIVGAATAGLLLPALAQAVDVNRANMQELRSVRGIGPKTAQMIIDERTRGGDFESLADLSERVKGIGPKKAAGLESAGLVVTKGGGKGLVPSPAAPAAASGKQGKR